MQKQADPRELGIHALVMAPAKGLRFVCASGRGGGRHNARYSFQPNTVVGKKGAPRLAHARPWLARGSRQTPAPVSELTTAIDELAEKVARFGRTVEADGKARAIAELEERMGGPGFWDDPSKAKGIVDQLKGMRNVVDPYLNLSRQTRDLRELADLGETEGDDGLLIEAAAELDRLVQAYDAVEVKLALSGRYDSSAVYLTIKPGAGGVEACDWASMLFRMYTQYCQAQGYTVQIMDMLPGEEAGLKYCTLRIEGPYAYGYFKSEMGTHRLVRMSPYNADGKRQTSFAAIEVTPEIDDTEVVETIPDKDLRIDTYRASGAGGQHVNKTDSAVRLTHIPTGLVAACQQERSQIQNRATAMKMLLAKLQQLKESERLDELKDLGADRGTIGWGHQIRSYFLQPTQRVLDLRTGHSTSQAHSVLDGALQPFIDSYLRWCLAGRPDRRQMGKEDD